MMMSTWNVSENASNDYELRNRTNNALENYNRRVNSLFPTAHPSLGHFVHKIEEESRYQLKCLDDIRFGHVVITKPQEAIIAEILALYTNFVAPQDGMTGNV